MATLIIFLLLFHFLGFAVSSSLNSSSSRESPPSPPSTWPFCNSGVRSSCPCCWLVSGMIPNKVQLIYITTGTVIQWGERVLYVVGELSSKVDDDDARFGESRIAALARNIACASRSQELSHEYNGQVALCLQIWPMTVRVCNVCSYNIARIA